VTPSENACADFPDWERLLADLEAAAGWPTERVRRPVLILGRLDGILTGIRHFHRTAPLETEEVEGVRVPALAEFARVKAWLLATRVTTRDYLDTVVLLERLGEAEPSDASRIDLATYRGLVPPWNGWGHVASRGRAWARVLADVLLEPGRGPTT
jgi:hypothetical protein